MASKAAYQQKLEAQLKEWDANLALVRAKASKATADARVSFENELEKMKVKREEAHRSLEELGKRSESAWEDMKDSTEKVWAEMGKAMEKMTARFK